MFYGEGKDSGVLKKDFFLQGGVKLVGENLENIWKKSAVITSRSSRERLFTPLPGGRLVWVSFGQKAKRPMTKGHSKLAITKKATPRRPILRKANLTGRPMLRKAKILHIFRNLTPTPQNTPQCPYGHAPKEIFLPNLQNKYGPLTLALQNPPQCSQWSFPL